jgi:hypothetical protein
MRTLRNSIWRDRKLLRMQLTESDRMIIDKRLLETKSAFDNLLASTFSCRLVAPNQAGAIERSDKEAGRI